MGLMNLRSILLLVLALAGAPALAQNVARGEALYDAYCSGCHGHPPRGGPDTVEGNPSVIRTALAKVSQMRFLQNSLSDPDIVDIAAYLGELAGIPSRSSTSYQGLWLKTPFESESGWGLNLTHQGDILFATWFTYDTDGSDMWLVMSNGARRPDGSYFGELYRTTGPGFNAVPFTSIGLSNYTTVGTLSLTFTDGNTGTMTYTVNGVTQSKPIARFTYVLSPPTCTLGAAPGASPNYQDLWWNSPDNSESGWGVNITHQGDILVATWFTYQAGGTAANPAKGLWLIMSNGARSAPGVYSGELQRTTGPAFSAVPFNPSSVTRNTVGDATFTFTDADRGTFRYTVNGITQTKAIKRLLYASPVTVCK